MLAEYDAMLLKQAQALATRIFQNISPQSGMVDDNSVRQDFIICANAPYISSYQSEQNVVVLANQ